MSGFRRLARTCAVVVLLAMTSGCGLLRDGAYDLPLPGGPEVGSDPRTISLEFSTVEGLVPQSMVKVGNVAVGEVSDIGLDRSDWTATVTCRVRGDVAIPANAEATIRRSSLLGEWFVELTPPDGEPARGSLPDRAVIGLPHTSQTAQVEEVLGALSLLLNQGGIPQLEAIIRELRLTLDGRTHRVRGLLHELDDFTGELDRNREGVVAALRGLDRLSRTLRANRRDLAHALEQLPGGIRTLAAQRTQLVAMLRSLDSMSRVTTDVVRRSHRDTVADLTALQPTLAKLAAAGEDLPGSLELLVTFPFTPAARHTVKGDFVNLDADVSLDLQKVIDAFGRAPSPLATDPGTVLTQPAPGPWAPDPHLVEDIIGQLDDLAPADDPTAEDSAGDLGDVLGSIGLGGR